MTMQTLGTANVFNGTRAEGRTLVDRELYQAEAVHLQAYLESAPVVPATAGAGPRAGGRHQRPAGADDKVDRRRVAVARPVPYYLRTYALPPDPVFADHIRQRRYQAPTVDPARKQATQAVSGGNRRLAAG
jgi:hypothetical protein